MTSIQLEKNCLHTQVNEFFTGTMASILRLERRKMPKKNLEKFEQAEKGQIKTVVPTVVFGRSNGQGNKLSGSNK